MTVRKPLLFGTGIIRTFGVTIKHFFMKSLTVQYPYERIPIAEISRGMLRLKGTVDAGNDFVPAFSQMPPCQERCPANVDARGYIGLVAQGRYDDAYELHLQQNPLPGIISRICPHPCERMCRRGEEDAPVTICDLKGFMFDHTSAGRRQKIFTLPKERKGKKVAVVGGGPAGLSVAFWLGKCGYDVVVFERLPVAGGIVRAAIAPARLPADIIDQEVEDIRRMCVAIRTNTPIGPGGLSLDDLFAKEFDAVFLGIGAHRKVPVKGKDKTDKPAEPELSRAEKNAWLIEQGVELDDQGNIVVQDKTRETSRPGVFAGGEAILGPGVTVTTVGCARRAARSIDTFLNGTLSDYWEHNDLQAESIKSRYDTDTPRPPRTKPGEEAPGLTEKQAIAQAERCMSCMTEQCIGCRVCEKYCPPQAIKVVTSQDKSRRTIDAYEVDYGKCQLCATCVDVCPTRTLTHTPEFETGDYGRPEMIYGKDKMLRITALREDKYAKHPKTGTPKDAS
jgi:NADPH-dependent glutamate synthase beta subunit-like oxidoreductase